MSISSGFVKPAISQFEDPVGATGQLLVVCHEDHAESLAIPKVKQKVV